MDECLRVNTKMIKNKDMGFTDGLITENTKEIGQMESNMG